MTIAKRLSGVITTPWVIRAEAGIEARSVPAARSQKPTEWFVFSVTTRCRPSGETSRL